MKNVKEEIEKYVEKLEKENALYKKYIELSNLKGDFEKFKKEEIK